MRDIILKRKKYEYLDMFALSFKTSPLYSLIFLIEKVLSALLPIFSIFITANFINKATEILNKKAELSDIFLPVGLLAVVMVYGTIMQVIMNFIECKRSIYFRDRLTPEIIERQAKLEYRHVENPDVADLKARVTREFAIHVWSMYSCVLGTLNLLFLVAGIFITIFTQVWWVAMAMLFIYLPILFFAEKTGHHQYNSDRKLSIFQRHISILTDMMRSREAVDERSMYGFTESVNNKYSEQYRLCSETRLKSLLRVYIIQFSGAISGNVYLIIVVLALLSPAINGSLGFGMFVGIVQAVLNLSERLSIDFFLNINETTKAHEYLKDLTEFMKLEVLDDATAIPEKGMMFNRIEFKNVSFKYPDTEKLVLDDISLVFDYGKNYSIVGSNGSGKTTIIKLLTGLYTNYDGEILIDGRSLRKMSQAQIKGLSSVVYQDFIKYSIPICSNIAIGDIGGTHNREKIEKAVELVGLSEKVMQLPDGLETPLGKILENGVDFSGGEWQRIAIARGYMGDSLLKILDEPTAALDPISETKVYRNFEEISKNKTTIFISHRLGSTKLADTIFVLDSGKLVEQGSHAELMALDKIYAKMFNSQAKWYKNENEEEVSSNV